MLPEGAIYPKVYTSQRDLAYHIVSEGETLGLISQAYNLSIQEIIAINGIVNPRLIRPGDKIYVDLGKRKGKLAGIIPAEDWRNYGSLKVKWSEWKVIDNSYITPAVNQGGKTFFLAVNCSSHRINSTGRNNKWKEWLSPKSEFEFNLIDDLCKG